MDRKRLEPFYAPAASEALKSFPVEVERTELVALSENVTFRVWVRDSDTDYALRLHRPGYNSIEELESERVWSRALNEAGVSVQDSLLTHEGKYFVPVDIPGIDEQRYVGVTTWLEGPLLSDYLDSRSDKKERIRIFHRMGEIAATIHNQSSQWAEPAGFQRHRLDLDGLLGQTPFWGRFWEHTDLTRSEKAILLQARHDARIALKTYGERQENFSLIHADLHPDNIVLNGDDLSLIDFDDSAYGWHMYEIASVLIEYQSDPDFETLCTVLLKGYCEHRPLARRDIEMLPTFLLVRGMATIGWFHQRPEHTGSEYFEQVKNWVFDLCASKRR